MNHPESSASADLDPVEPDADPAGSDAELTPLYRLDGPELFALTHDNREHLRAWLPWVDRILLPEHTQAFVDAAVAQEKLGKQKHFMLRLHGAIIGTISLIDIGDGQGTVGYWLARANQGRGYVTRGLLQVKSMAMTEMGLDRLHLEYLEGNLASARVAARCGFEPNHVIPKGAVLYGRELDRICCIARKSDVQN